MTPIFFTESDEYVYVKVVNVTTTAGKHSVDLLKVNGRKMSDYREVLETTGPYSGLYKFPVNSLLEHETNTFDDNITMVVNGVDFLIYDATAGIWTFDKITITQAITAIK